MADRHLSDTSPSTSLFDVSFDSGSADFGPPGSGAVTTHGVRFSGRSRAELRALEDRLDRIDRAYCSVQPGDRYALTYPPGNGTQLSLNNRHVELIEGSDFARAYFGIWLGRYAIDKPLRRQLLS